VAGRLMRAFTVGDHWCTIPSAGAVSTADAHAHAGGLHWPRRFQRTFRLRGTPGYSGVLRGPSCLAPVMKALVLTPPCATEKRPSGATASRFGAGFSETREMCAMQTSQSEYLAPLSGWLLPHEERSASNRSAQRATRSV
jgi:hypothetical protein